MFLSRGQGSFEPREVQLSAPTDEGFVVLKGLKSGDTVVTSANFLIDSESQLQAAAGAYIPPPSGAGAAAAMNGPEPQASVELTTDPSPPHRGTNHVQVKLSSSDGKPLSAARVTVRFFMNADARQTDFCVYLSAILLAGLILNAVLGWWWADPVAALTMVPIVAKEGFDGVKGQACCDSCHPR